MVDGHGCNELLGSRGHWDRSSDDDPAPSLLKVQCTQPGRVSARDASARSVMKTRCPASGYDVSAHSS